jgi:hypothetical protein
MDAALKQILSELRVAALSGSATAGVSNMRAIVLARGCPPLEVLDFLDAAAEVLLSRALADGIVPATFYTWYDDQAGQLRFSLVRGTTQALPFSVDIELLPSPHAIVTAALSSATPGLIPWSELTDAGFDAEDPLPGRTPVWARTRGTS